MSKRRTIWPDLLTDRRRRKTSMGAMCLYYDLLMCTDDQGIYPLDVDKIILEVIPYFRGDDEEVVQFLHELVENNFIETYFPKGHKEEFLLVSDWHQQGAMSSEYNKYPNKDGIVGEGKKRLGGMQRVSVIKTLALEHDYTCPCCSKKMHVDADHKITDLFTIMERINTKSRGSKYAENYNLLCKECSKTQTRHTLDTKQTQCVTSVDTDVTHTGLRDKGLGLRDKGLGLRDKVINKQEVADAPDVVENNSLELAEVKPEFPYLTKLSKKYHENVIKILDHWAKSTRINWNRTENSDINKKRAKLVVERLKEGKSLEVCLKAIDGLCANEWYVSKNRTDIRYIFDSEKFEDHINTKTAAQHITEARGESAYSRIKKRMREEKEINVTPSTGQYEHIAKM